MSRSSATRAGWLAVALATLAVSPAAAQGPVELSSAPIAENPAWAGYVLGTGELTAKPVRINATSGDVTNAEGLIDPAKGPAKLTYSGSGRVPMIILDYGREVGGLPFFTASGVTPTGTATSVTLRAAYSEAREFLWTPGNTTLSLAAATGDTNVKVGSVTNFVVGDTIQVGSQTATITAVGTQARSTTLFAPAAVGDTNVKVAATTGLAAGDALNVGDQTVTITNVGTQGRATTLSTAAAAGATNIRVASVTGLVPNSDITVGGQPARVVTVGTQGANGTGLTLAEPLANAVAAGGPVRYDGTGITFTPALTAAQGAGATVLAPGTGITIDAPLTGAQAAGATVRSTPGALTGDRVGFNGVGMSASRAENFSFSAPGTLGNAANQMQGGERFQAITITTPGTLEVSAVGIHFRHPNSPATDYAGRFLSSDDKLNKIWYQGAYTNDTNSVPIGAVPGQTIPVILDGAKRDRRPWSGDLDLQGRTAFTSLGFGPKGSDYIKGTLHSFGGTQMADGRIFGHIQNWTVWPPSGGFYSTSYSMYHVLSVAGLLPVLGRHRIRPRAVRDHQAPARVQPVARRSDERLPDHERRWRRPRLGLLRRWQARRGHRVQRHLLQGAERRGLPRRRAGQGVSERRGSCGVAGRLGALEDPGRRPQTAHQRGAVRPPARRLQARRPRQRHHVGQRRPAGRQLRGGHVGHRAGERA